MDSSGRDLDVFGRQPTKKHHDWSHRRREPRGLALAWMVYLMLTTVVSLIPMVLTGQLSSGVYRPAARMMMVLVMLGAVVLWPVLRVSQAAQRAAPVLDVCRDLAVLLIPAMVLLWPQVILAGWPISVVASATIVLGNWVLVSGVVLLWWHRYSEGSWVGRLAVAMIVSVMAGLVPLLLASFGHLSFDRPGPDPAVGWMWSPLTAVWEVLRERVWSGTAAAVSVSHRTILQAQFVGASLLFLFSAVWCRGRRRLAAQTRGGYAD